MSFRDPTSKEEIEDHPDSLMCGACRDPFLPERISEDERQVDVVRVRPDDAEPVPICPDCRNRLRAAGVLKPTEKLPENIH